MVLNVSADAYVHGILVAIKVDLRRNRRFPQLNTRDGWYKKEIDPHGNLRSPNLNIV